MSAGFLGSTVGLMRTRQAGEKIINKLVRVEFEQNPDDTITMTAVSGHNLAPTGQRKKITREQLDNIPGDGFGDTDFAQAAMSMLGWN